MRYWVAFNQERAAQSCFRSVLCCSGRFAPTAGPSSSAIWPAYIARLQRHPLHLRRRSPPDKPVLAKRITTLFLPQARARTNAPETIRGYLKQQLRWNKSFYREVLWTLPFLSRPVAYIVFEMSCR